MASCNSAHRAKGSEHRAKGIMSMTQLLILGDFSDQIDLLINIQDTHSPPEDSPTPLESSDV